VEAEASGSNIKKTINESLAASRGVSSNAQEILSQQAAEQWDTYKVCRSDTLRKHPRSASHSLYR